MTVYISQSYFNNYFELLNSKCLHTIFFFSSNVDAAKVNNSTKKPNIDLAKRPLPARPPQPPPRVKKQSEARAFSKPSNSINKGPQRPNVPPPAAPTSAATLEIGEPTSVTINGVKVMENEVNTSNNSASAGGSISGPPSVSTSVTAGSFIVPATPAMANEDIPDSMQSVPPPVPTCPPPEFDDEDQQ